MITQYSDERVAYSVPVINGVVTSATWAISPTGPTISSEAIVVSTGYPQALVTGTVNGTTYELHAHCVLDDGQELDSRMFIRGA